MLVDGLPEFGTDHDQVDFAGIARAAGLHSRRVEKPSEVRDGIREILAHDGPAVLDVVTDPNALSIPPNITAAQVKGFALAASKTVLSGGVGKMLNLAKSNLRNIPRP
jgi:pyruvate dehydrogenase (quinone)